MNSLRKFYFLALVFILSGHFLVAQEDKQGEPQVYVVYFQDGSIIKGQLLDLQLQGDITLLVEGEKIMIPASKVKKIGHTGKIWGLMQNTAERQRTYDFQEKGFYHATGLMVNTGENLSGNTWGLGLQHVSGYQFNRWVGLGLGIGVDAYALNQEKPVISLFGDVRGYLTATRVAPFYNFQMGYGEMRNKNIRDASGGLLVYPALGVRMSARTGANLAVDLGYKYQKASFEFDNPWWWQSYESWEYRYHRYVLRLSLTF